MEELNGYIDKSQMDTAMSIQMLWVLILNLGNTKVAKIIWNKMTYRNNKPQSAFLLV